MDYQKRLREAFKGLTSVVQAVGMLKYDKGAYKVNLTQKQGSLVDAVSEYGENRLLEKIQNIFSR